MSGSGAPSARHPPQNRMKPARGAEENSGRPQFLGTGVHVEEFRRLKRKTRRRRRNENGGRQIRFPGGGGGRGGAAVRAPEDPRPAGAPTPAWVARAGATPSSSTPRATKAGLRPPCGRAPSPTRSQGKWRREAEGWGKRCTNRPPRSARLRPSLQRPTASEGGGGPGPRPRSHETGAGGRGGRLPQRRQRPRHALSNNSLISNPLPPSRTQSLQPDFPQPSEMREISAVAREPDSSWRCSKNCRRWRNNKARGTSAR